ncbi:hypothetical protein EYZ11_004380 [Aspergillus tanneri]|uniref:Suppressor of tub2 mutation n=1 Tax=Aspergillus tanneri TaxID=1220188 RepID=A0A4S3JKP7_9EURO|nr:suppressor of tub2 mutation [Aspergillus tanneri]KAA8651842.1 suppressor of tub2 mutation [Aspergillus tanneri]THC96159.1 hypothetical protein EYZ11_004380 [Aspergillus tanneri]
MAQDIRQVSAWGFASVFLYVVIFLQAFITKHFLGLIELIFVRVTLLLVKIQLNIARTIPDIPEVHVDIGSVVLYLCTCVLCLLLLLEVFLLRKAAKLLRSIFFYTVLFLVKFHWKSAWKMEAKADELREVLENTNLAIEAKVRHLLGVKSDIKQKNVPREAVPTLFESIRLAIASQYQAIFSAGISALGHLVKRLSIQGQRQLVALQARMLYPILLERIGSHRGAIRAQAAQALEDLWHSSQEEVERYVQEALGGGNPKAKEMAMIWTLNMSKKHELQYALFVPTILLHLEDADGSVRETAKSTIIELYRDVNLKNKTLLKQTLEQKGVRKSIRNAILESIGVDVTENSSGWSPGRQRRPATRAESHSRPVVRAADALQPRPATRTETRTAAADRVAAADTITRLGRQLKVTRVPARNATPGPSISRIQPQSPSPKSETSLPVRSPSPRVMTKLEPTRSQKPTKTPAFVHQPPGLDETDAVPLLVRSTREIDDYAKEMLFHFEGRESENNWLFRERSVITLRRLVIGNAPRDFPDSFFPNMRTLLDGVFKTVHSLRTTLTTNGCLCIQDLARWCGPQIDSMVEIIMQNLIKLCSVPKKIAAHHGDNAVQAVIMNVTITARVLYHVSSACEDKRVQVRLFAAGWVRAIIDCQSTNRTVVEHGGGVDMIVKSITKGLGDANPEVRAAMRHTFWRFDAVWPARAKILLSDLDAKSRTLLEKDSNNPNLNKPASPARPSSAKSAKASKPAAPGRTALREAIAAQKKAHLSLEKSAPSTESTASRAVPTETSLTSLSSAPLRPNLKSRTLPPTAELHASRTPASDVKSNSSKPSDRLETSRTSNLKQPTPAKSIVPVQAKKNLEPKNKPEIKPAATRPKKLDLSAAIFKAPNTSGSESQRNAKEILTKLSDESCSDSEEEPALLGSFPMTESLPQNIDDNRRDAAVVVTPSIFRTAEPEKKHNANDRSDDEESIASCVLTEDLPDRGSEASEWIRRASLLPEDFLWRDLPSYDDDEAEDEAPKVGVLAELPETNLPFERPEDRQTRRSSPVKEMPKGNSSVSPQPKDPAKSQHLLDRGIQLIRSNSMDANGLRKLRQLIAQNGSSVNTCQFRDLVASLLGALEFEGGDHQPAKISQGRIASLRLPILETIEEAINGRIGEQLRSSPHLYSQAIASLLRTRRCSDTSCYFSLRVDEVAMGIIRSELGEGTHNSVHALVDTIVAEERGKEGDNVIIMGLSLLACVLRHGNKEGTRLPEDLMEKVGSLAANHLMDEHPEIRRQVMQLSVHLHSMVADDDQFWRVVGRPQDGSRNLLTYYIARN